MYLYVHARKHARTHTHKLVTVGGGFGTGVTAVHVSKHCTDAFRSRPHAKSQAAQVQCLQCITHTCMYAFESFPASNNIIYMSILVNKTKKDIVRAKCFSIYMNHSSVQQRSVNSVYFYFSPDAVCSRTLYTYMHAHAVLCLCLFRLLTSNTYIYTDIHTLCQCPHRWLACNSCMRAHTNTRTHTHTHTYIYI
jgi:hypothetical protein